MKLVCTGPRDSSDHASVAAAVSGAVRISQHPELLQRVDPQQNAGGASGCVVTRVIDIAAIEQKADLARAVAADHQFRSQAAGIGGAARRSHAGCEQGELREVASVQRKLPDRIRVHSGRERRIARFHQGGVGSNHGLRGDRADAQREIQYRLAAYRQQDRAALGRLEAIEPRRQRVLTRRQVREQIISTRVGVGRAPDAGCLVLKRKPGLS